MNKIKILVSVFILTGFSAIFAEESDNKNNWAIQYSFGSGNGEATNFSGGGGGDIFPLLLLSGSNNINPLFLLSSLETDSAAKTSIYTSSFHAEYYPSWFGFVFGVSSHQYDITPASNPLNDFLPLLLLSSSSGSSSGSSSTSSFIPLLLISSMSESDKLSFIGSTLDFGMNFHMNRTGTFDPYFGILFGIGTAGTGTTIGKAEAKLGLRINIGDSFYLFGEGYGAAHSLEISVGNGETVNSSISDTGGKLGFGIRI
ncbi:hypothetical protein [Leptospira sp. GIMC2001]|uniref:hypothetical protein n=1 Tax=Leptospira sp. GIMC2001 TaxID=1513297 RepID=UPI002349F5BC|nr:hypothetical protein [Leptospira sp. GIMC2001]WCL50973.1 hypothetical protein O4O04_09220 [Leptospira sp. GIMC2001]